MYSSSLSSRKRDEVRRSRKAFWRVDIWDGLGMLICNLGLVGVLGLPLPPALSLLVSGCVFLSW